jgi:hypothetical protein
MSVKTLCLGCLTPIKIPEDLRGVIRQDTDGSVYINVVFNERGSCGEYEAAYGCHENPTLAEIFHSTIVEDECGQCGVNILINCDICDEAPAQ